MELWDVLDASGRPTGRVIERGSTLDKGEYYLGVHIYIVNSTGKFLVQKRAKCKRHYPDIWDINMGHVIAGETSKQAAIREIDEEIGVELRPDELKLVKRFNWDMYNHIVDIWLAHKDIDIACTVLQREEVSQVKYITKSEMVDMLADTSENRPFRPLEYIEAIRSIKA